MGAVCDFKERCGPARGWRVLGRPGSAGVARVGASGGRSRTGERHVWGGVCQQKACGEACGEAHRQRAWAWVGLSGLSWLSWLLEDVPRRWGAQAAAMAGRLRADAARDARCRLAGVRGPDDSPRGTGGGDDEGGVLRGGWTGVGSEAEGAMVLTA